MTNLFKIYTPIESIQNELTILENKGVEYNDFVFVDTLNKFPPPIGGIIVLSSRSSWLITTDIDLDGNRIVCEGNSTIQGISSETCSLFSTNLPAGNSLITSAFTLPIQGITLGCPDDCSVFDLNSDGTNGIDIGRTNFGSATLSCGSIGTIQNYSNTVFLDCAFLNLNNSLTFDGTIGSVVFNNCFFMTSVTTATPVIEIATTLVITRRFRIVDCSLVIFAGKIGIDVVAGANLPDEGFILSNVNFSGGGTFLQGIDYTSNKSLISDCIGVRNSFVLGILLLENNVTVTALTQNINTQIAGTYTTDINNLGSFTFAPIGDLTYIAPRRISILVSVNASIIGGSNKEGFISVGQNGVVSSTSSMKFRTGGAGAFSHVSTSAVLTVSVNDVISLFIRNITDGTDMTVEELVCTVTGIL